MDNHGPSLGLANRRRRKAPRTLLATSERTIALSQARYETGQDSHLVDLDAQRTLHAARSGLVAVQRAEQANRVAAYRVLEGSWSESGARQ